MIRALVFLLLCLSGPAMSRQITVRSGEHADFSRLVFEFAPQTTWRLGRTEAGYALQIGGAETSYGLSDVYRLIPRSRIAELTQTGGRLTIRLGCDCHATALLVREGLLAVDIRDGAPAATAAFEQAFDVPPVRPADSAQDQPSLAALAGTAPLRTTHPDAASGAGLVLPPPPPPAAWPLPLPRAVDRDAANAVALRVEEAQDALLEQLARAAAQGLVKPRINREIAAISADRSATEPDVAAPAVPAPVVPDPLANLNILAVTAIDRDRPDAAALAAAARAAERCIDDARLDVGTWADDRAAAEQFSDARRDLLGEFDAPDTAAVLHLSEVYLHFGFGAEAALALALFEVPEAEAGLLRALAEIMDHGAMADPALFRDQLSCPGAAAFWAAMATDPLPPARIDTAAVIRHFSALPLSLRRHLGPTLAERFLAAGDGGTARALRDAIARSDGDHGPAFRLMEAHLDLDDGADAAARKKLAGLTTTEDAIAPEALVMLLRHLRADGRAAADPLIEDALAQGFEHRRIDLGARLTGEAVLSLAARGEMGPALAALEIARHEQEDPQHRLSRVVPEVLRLSLSEAPDAALIEAVFTYPDVLDDARSDPAMRRALTRRLLDSGLAPVADRFMSQAVRGRPSGAPEDRLLLAEIRLAEGEPDSALALIESLQGDEAALLRARILSARGDASGALAALPPGATALERAAYARRAGAWGEALGAAPEALRADLTRLAVASPDSSASPEPDPAAPPPPASRDPAPASLAAGRDALADSRSAREAIASLLSGLELDGDPARP